LSVEWKGVFFFIISLGSDNCRWWKTSEVVNNIIQNKKPISLLLFFLMNVYGVWFTNSSKKIAKLLKIIFPQARGQCTYIYINSIVVK